MDIKFKLLPPTMPNFVFYEIPPQQKQNGVTFDNKIAVGTFTESEATDYGELMKQAFISHWNNIQRNKEKLDRLQSLS